MEKSACPNCNKKIGGILFSNSLLTIAANNFINIFTENPGSGYCTDCGTNLFNACVAKLASQKSDVLNAAIRIVDVIPIVTAQSPLKWDYSVIEMVSSQSVTGTGLLSEISSSWTDMLGGQSDALSNKLGNGETICRKQLRIKAAMLGGNCILATDIDYAEVGGVKGMLMVCMSGTAANLHNIEDVLELDKEKLSILQASIAELKRLNTIAIPQMV